MRKGKQILVIILASLMVLTMGGTWLSGALNSYAAGSETSDNAATAENTDAKESLEEVKKDDSSKGGSDVQTDQTDAGSDTKTETKLVQRDIKAEVQEDVLYETVNNKKKDSEALERVNSFISALTGGKTELSDDSGKKREAPVAVTVSGELPEDVTAEASYIEFAKPDKDDTSAENMLYAVDITLRNADGNVYIPESKLTVSIEGSSIKDAAENDEHILVYSYAENEVRREKLDKKGVEDAFSADTLVYKEKGTDDEALLYEVYDRNKEYKDNEDAVRFADSKDSLSREKDNVISFEYSADWNTSAAFTNDGKTADKEEIEAGIPAQFVLSVQKSAEELAKIKEEQQKDEADKDADVDTDVEGKDETVDEKKEDEPASHDKTLTATDDKNYKVTLKYSDDAGLPDDAKLEVEMIKGLKYRQYRRLTAAALDADNVDYIHIFDITIVDKAGTEYEPKTSVDVSIEMLKEKNAPEELQVVHFDEEKTAELLDSETENGVVSFSTESFSVYSITEAFTRTYIFNIWNPTDNRYEAYVFISESGEETSSQTVKNGEKPLVPQISSNSSGQPFSGWYAKKNGSEEFEDKPYDFNKPVTESEVVDLYAVFNDYLYAVFHDQYSPESGSFPIADTRRGVPDNDGTAKIKIDDVSTTYNNGNDMAFYGWSYTPISNPASGKDDKGDPIQKITPDDDGYIEIKAETPLYPIFKSIKWLTFWSGPTGSGATYYPAQKYFDGAGPESLPVPKRTGYTFQGWYAGYTEGEEVHYGDPLSNEEGQLIDGASDGGMTVYDGHLHLISDATLYAKWTGENSADYKIIIWKQKASASASTPEKYKFDFVESHVKTAPLGSDATIDEAYKEYAETKPTEFGGYTCRCDDPVPVDENGYTVLNVYYETSESFSPSGNYDLVFTDSADDKTEYAAYRVNMIGTGGVNYDSSLLKGNDGGSYVPDDPKKDNYTFKGWYADSICSTRVFFSREDLDAYTGYDKTVLYEKMPDKGLVLYAGWEADWYIVQIDPNYGSFNGTGSTWFWKTVDSDLIQEYTQVTRDYVESSSGTYYYRKLDRAYYGYSGNEWDKSEPDRDAYYTDKPGEATEYKTFEHAPGVYSYAGWFEVHEDGSETPYVFGSPVDHDTTLRLHWKKTGNYYLKYNAGNGTLDGGGKEAVDTNNYADNASIVMTRGANAPDGYTFIGWSVKGDESGKVYAVGDFYTLESDYAVSISGRNTVTLEAVYAKLGNASITYDLNGGSYEGDFDYGHPEDTGDVVDWDESSKTVSNIVNNTAFFLSDTELSRNGAIFMGWTTSEDYDPDKDTLFLKGQKYGVDKEEPTTLHAVWKVQVKYHLNAESGQEQKYNWGGDWAGYLDEGSDKVKDLYIGNTETEPSDIPQYDGTDKMFRYWVSSPNSSQAYDFSQPVSGNLDLYAYWAGPIEVPVHAVNASSQTITVENDWVASGASVPVTTEPVTINSGLAGNYVHPSSSNYEYAFAVALDRNSDINRSSVSEDKAISAIYYNQSKKHLYVKYADTSRADAELSESCDIYFIYYEKKALDISYRKMLPSGELAIVENLDGAAPVSTGTELLGSYDMTENVNKPKEWAGAGYENCYYAYAIGTDGATDASGLSLITDTSESDTARPVLKLNNSWNGFRYATKTGDDAVWTDCGFEPTLYVIYFEQKPTVVMFREKTVGINDVMDTEFTYNLKVTQTTTGVKKQRKTVDDSWEDTGEEITDITSDIFDTTVLPNKPYKLKNGEASSAVLFYSKPGDGEQIGEEFRDIPIVGETYRYIATADSETSQKVVITQDADDSFDISIFENGRAYSEKEYSYEAVADQSGGTKDAEFRNTHKAAEIEIHVAQIESGTIKLRDNLRSSDESKYKFSLPINTSAKLKEKLPESVVYNGNRTLYGFGDAVLGSDDDDTVNIEEFGAFSVDYESVGTDHYELVLKDSDGSILGELGSGSKVYYLYYMMPKAQYVKQTGSGDDALITFIWGATGNTVTYDGAAVEMNGQVVRQNQMITIPTNGLLISQESGNSSFKMPPILDDSTFLRYLSYSRIAVGPGLTELENTRPLSELTINTNKPVMRFRLEDNKLEWSFDGNEWHGWDDSQTVFAIYDERGYDMQISKVVDTSASGDDPIFTDKDFTVTIEPENGNSFNKEQYEIEGYSSSPIPVVDGKITLTVRDGTKVKILGMRQGQYKITESNNENFELSAKSGPIIGTATTTETVSDSSLDFTLDTEKQLVLTNSPKAICEVTREDEEDGPVFYKLKDAVDYIVNNFSDRTANIEMLTDYLMPAADAPEIPSNTHITLTTASTGDQRYDNLPGKAVIIRSDRLNSASMISNSGDLSLKDITIDGAEITASEPMIRSTGQLTVDMGTTLQNAINTGDGGAIYATGTVRIADSRDDQVNLKYNKAANGAVLYYAGRGTVEVVGGKITDNTATANGGAIYAAGGTLNLSGTANNNLLLSNNKAVNGGAIYSDKAVIEINGYVSMTGNTAKDSSETNGCGGAVYTESGALTMNGCAMSGNIAADCGGAVYTGTGASSIADSTLNENNAKYGGAVYTRSGRIELSGEESVVRLNTASEDGGAFYSVSGSITLTGGRITDNSAAKNGGAVFSSKGRVSVSEPAEVSNNTARSGNGGAVYTESGAVSVSGGSLTVNKAENGYGGAIYVDSGSATISGGVIGKQGLMSLDQYLFANIARNGAAVYVKTGTGNFSGGKIEYNKATEGGAVGVGSDSAILNFSGAPWIKNNIKNQNPGEIDCNVFLDQDTDSVIKTSGFSGAAKKCIGIYVPDRNNDEGEEYLFKNRGNVGGRFGICGGNQSKFDEFENDREKNLQAVVDSNNKRIYWSSLIKVEVRYLSNDKYRNSLPDGTNGDVKYGPEDYYPTGNLSTSAIAEELRGKCSKLSATSVYATALIKNDSDYSHYLTNLNWTNGKWKYTRRDGSSYDLAPTDTIVIYFAEPAYISIENNAPYELDLSSLTVSLAGKDRSLLNSTGTTGITGIGLAFAINGAIQSDLMPVEMTSGHYNLGTGDSISILIPGGQGRAYSLNGQYVSGSGTVRLRINGDEKPAVSAVDPFNVSGTTFSNSNTYEIVFGENKPICKINCNVDPSTVESGDYIEYWGSSGNIEYTFSKLNQAVDFAIKYKLKDVTIEMLVDYLVPGTDDIAVVKGGKTIENGFAGFDSFKLTTATTGHYTYQGERATLSRGVGNTNPLVDVEGKPSDNGLFMSALTDFEVYNLNFDGKNLAGKCDGGAIKTKECKANLSNVGFVNCVAYNGGAVFVSFGSPVDGETVSYSFPTDYDASESTLTADNITFTNCESKKNGNKKRTGGGAIWSNAKTLTINDSFFTNCKSSGTDMQGGAVFHRIEAAKPSASHPLKTPYAEESKSDLNKCTFTNCVAAAGGGLESDALNVSVKNSRFERCSTNQKDGGAINIYIYETNMNYTSIPSTVYMEGCEFLDCTGYRNAGAVRSIAVYNRFVDCTFSNTTATGFGGAICVSNQDSKTTFVEGCSFSGAVANNGQGGAVYTLSKELTVKCSTKNEKNSFTSCEAKGNNGNGGAIYHNANNRQNLNNSYTSISDCSISNCKAAQSGGGIYTYAQNKEAPDKKLLVNSTIQNCKASANSGGGVFIANPNSMDTAIIEGIKISGCSATKEGGGLYCVAKNLSVGDYVPEGGDPVHSVIEGCSSGTDGGGVYQYNSAAPVAFTNCTIQDCTAANNGGGFHSNWANSVSFTGCLVKNNTVTSSSGLGGGICQNTSAKLTLNNTTVSGNKAGCGGGVYVKKDIWMICSFVTGNQLLSNNVENAAGVYMAQNGGYFEIGESNVEKDNSAVMNNTTNNGADSNLRLRIKNNGENDNSVRVNCRNLGEIDERGGYFGVVNAYKVGTQFGQAMDPHGFPGGFYRSDAVFHSDTNTLYGIIDSQDDHGQRLIWAGPPICKITTSDGKPLFFNDAGSDNAIFDILEDGLPANGSNTKNNRSSAFRLLRFGNIQLYTAPDPDDPDSKGALYEGTIFRVEMLVEEYELTNQITTIDSTDRSIILTTAKKKSPGDPDNDFYFDENASGDRGSIIRGEDVAGSMVKPRVNMEFTNILLDGGNAVSNEDGAIINVNTTKDIRVELKTKAVLQYGKAVNGGAVSVSGGSFILDNGLIRFCEASANGGAVYANNSNTEKGFAFKEGDIQQCEAVDGAGVYVANGKFDMSGGRITGCVASRSGGGVFVAAGKKMDMSGGTIGNSGPNSAVTSGGGIAVGGDTSELQFSKQVNISKNTCSASDASGKICNVELSCDSNLVIRTGEPYELWNRSYIGVYVPGSESDEDSLYSKHGEEEDPFGHFTGSSTHLHCFVNDRNGLKGGIIANPEPDTIYWIKIFSIELTKAVTVSDNIPDDAKEAALQQEFKFTVRLWEPEGYSGAVKVKDIAEEIAEYGEDSRYGDIMFQKTVDPKMIMATVVIKDGDINKKSSENLPEGLIYEITEEWTPGYCHIPDPDDANMKINYKKGATGENKSRTDINPYVSSVVFNNMMPVCKITDASGNLLYKDDKHKTAGQSPAVYKDLSEAFEAVNIRKLFQKGGDVGYNGNCKIEMLVPDYYLTDTINLFSDKGIALTTSKDQNEITDTTDAGKNFYYSGSSASTIIRRRSFNSGPMLKLSMHYGEPSVGSDLTLENINLDGSKIEASCNGGIVQVNQGTTLRLKSGAILNNSRIASDKKGAGVYLAGGSHLYMSGNPQFGGTDRDGFDNIRNRSGNFRNGDIDETNGGKPYTIAHQDIYLEEGFSNNGPAIIIITGPLSGEKGSIWVWAEHSGDSPQKNYYETLMPFARILNKDTDPGDLSVFRDARCDTDTLASDTGSYLYGTDDGTRPENASDNDRFVYWYGIKGSIKVILRKVKGNQFEPRSGKTFTVYRGETGNSIAKDASGEPLPTDMKSKSSGVFWIGNLPYGIYRIEEDDGTVFKIKIDKDGIHDLKQNNKITKEIRH